MKKTLSVVLFALVIVSLVAGPVAARNEAINEIRFDGDCAGIKFNRAGKTVTIRILKYTKRPGSQWKYLGDETRETGSGNYVEFCGLSLYRDKVKITAQIIVNGRIKDSMTKVFTMSQPKIRELHPSWSSDGQKIAFVATTEDGDFDIFTMNVDGSGVKRLTKTHGLDMSPHWSPI